MRWSYKRTIAFVGAGILVAALVVSLTPWYKAYCADDHRWTCAKIRAIVDWDYGNALDAGESGSIGLLTKVLDAHFEADEYTLIPASSVTPADEESPEGAILVGLCKDGGTLHISVRENGCVTLTCDVEGHDIGYSSYFD